MNQTILFSNVFNPAKPVARMSLAVAMLAMSIGANPNSAFGQSTAWTGGAGNWSTATSWSPNPCAPNPPCYPNNPLWSVSIDGGKDGASPVTEDVPGGIGIQNLTIDSDDSLTINTGDSLSINGTAISNAGQITVNGAGGNGLVIAGANVSLTGGGKVTLAGGYITFTTGTQTLTNQETIDGAGSISVNFDNPSLIDANAGSPLTISSGKGTNSGTLEASGGGLLELVETTLSNAGGTINALAGSTVQLDNHVVINGGTLTTSGSGVIRSANNGPLLNGVTNSGTYQVPPGSTTLEGTFTNTGAFQLNSTASATAQILMSGAVTLSGGGPLTLSDQPRNLVSGTLVNQNNTISGSGTMTGGTLTNSGVINATSASHNQLLVSYTSSPLTNTGTMEASGGGTLKIQNNVTNTGGTIQSLAGTGTSAGGTVLLNSVTVTGGTLDTFGSGVNTGIIISTNSTFNGITNAGTLQLPDNSESSLEGTINNTGLIQFVSTTFGSTLKIIGNVTLSGTGNVTMMKNSVVSGSTGNEILTNQSTIQGAGNIGNGFMGLVNKGTILANQADTLTIRTDSQDFNNIGTLSVAKGSILDITQGPFHNFSGTTLTGGTYLVTGTLQFDNANIVTNAANITLSGQIVNQNNLNALLSFANNSSRGRFTLSGNQNLTTAGTFTNAGKVTLSKGSTFTVGGSSANYMQSGGTTLLDGTLTVPAGGLANITGGIIQGTGALPAAPTISGSMSLGNASGAAGTFIVGDSIKKSGLISIANNYTQLATGAVDVQIGGTTAGTRYSQLNITGKAALSGTLNIAIINAFKPTVGQTFTILNASTGITGTFSTVNGTSIDSTKHFSVSYNPTTVVLTVASGPAPPI